LELLGFIKADLGGFCVIRNRIYEGALAEIMSPAPDDRSGTQERRIGAPTTVFDQRGQHVGQQVNVAGDYIVDSHSPSHVVEAGVSESRATGASSTWDTAAIRELLTEAFNDEELDTLCFDHFRAVYEEFASGMSKGEKIRRLLDYCVRREQVETLLAQVRQGNPAQYARFEEQLKK